MRSTTLALVVAMVALGSTAAVPVAPPVAADPDPLACLGPSSGPVVGDGMTLGDANTDAEPLTYGCYSADLRDAADVDGYNVLGTPVRVQVALNDDAACAHVTWFQGSPPSNAISRWLCGHEAHEVSWHGIDPLRVQLWHGPSPTLEGPTPYTVRVLPDV